MYNWQNSEWPNFSYVLSTQTQHQLYEYALENGKLTGLLENIDLQYQQEIILEMMVLEAQKTSEIEDEIIHAEEIRSSLRQHLGIFQSDNMLNVDERAKGISDLLFENRSTFTRNLSVEVLNNWHKKLMQGSALANDAIGKFRNNPEPMQIVAGAIGRERVYFEAPSAFKVPQEMQQFLEWFNNCANNMIPAPVKAAIVHLYFESIHPFMDGNGRIGRALSEKILSQDLKTPILFSLSNTLMQNRKQYYQMLHDNSGNSLEISSWVAFFVTMVLQAQQTSKAQIQFVISKVKFWKKYSQFLNQRQTKVLKRMFAEGIKGFTGGINASKYMKIADTSKATATRDLSELVTKGCLKKLTQGGRNTSYDIAD